MKTHHSGSEHRSHRRHQAALLAIALLLAGRGEAAISISDYSAMGSDCGGVSSSSLSFSTPIGVQYRILNTALDEANACDGVNNTYLRSSMRIFDHVATDWNHPFHLQTRVSVNESWKMGEDGCIGGIAQLQPNGAHCAPPDWVHLSSSPIVNLQRYKTVITRGIMEYYGVNEINLQDVYGEIRREPFIGSAVIGYASATVEGESPSAGLAVGTSSIPDTAVVNVRALNKQQTTVNVPVPHVSFIYSSGVREPGFYAALPGSPAPRTFKNPVSPAVRTQVTASTDVAFAPPPLTDGWVNLKSEGPVTVTPSCGDDAGTACNREINYYGPFASELGLVLFNRQPIPAWALAPGSVVIGEIVTHELIPAYPAYDPAMGPTQWALQVAARVGRIVKRQPIYAAGGSGSCVPPSLAVATAMAAKRGAWTRLPGATVTTAANEPVVVQLASGGGLLQTNATVSGVTVVGSGSTSVQLHGLRSAVQAALTQRIVWYWNSDANASGDAVAVSAWRQASPACAVTRVLGVTVVDQNLLNIDFGVTGDSYGWSDKVGLAAIGFTTGDIWEAISHYFNSALVWSDGSASGASVSLNNSATPSATPVGSFSHTDAMMNDFNIRADNAVLGATVSQLPAGTYDVYVYAHRGSVNGNSRVTLRRNGTVIGTATTTPEAISATEAWSEGRQYVLFRNVTVGAGQSLEVLSAGPNGTGSGCLNGMQLLRK